MRFLACCLLLLVGMCSGRAIAVGTMSLAASCAGLSARADVLLPALRRDWPQVRALALRGDAQAEPAAARMDAALAAGRGLELGAAWPRVEVAALAGIEAELAAQEIGPTGAQIARTLVEQFGRDVAAMGGQ